ncbi:thiamine/thiamine pyrophosphate ABC transporter permease [Aurantimonas sp. VKM B-3413]|uniref:thiamine/thiamine pyrophosphate ABC transporter permease n=1 Tax=Aurantimonas sp. VKM B-3413 TaxID=2779401 RepID=UPI001E458FE4|nr:thiamine/thiamine pyrophosphate ABC transporter permease [Aurantimonas sp. VKM B-3413]MCB8840730.1 thiamine/thiamine pyrophosphate ABC transporter permease [Aurantimonas sp. VKM B-3413]
MMRGTDRRVRIALGAAATALLFAFLGGAFVLLAASGDTAGSLLAAVGDPYIRSLVWFTLEQAVLSTVLSVVGAVPLALALHRIRFFGRGAVLRLFLLPQALPVLVGALAIIAVWGRNGAVSSALAALGMPRLDVYGLSGILIAHVFFNLPLAARLILSALDRVPAESWKLAGQLALPPLATFRLIEWPAIRPSLPGAAGLVFMLCVTSFTLVLVLGGGPGATTLEVAIYQALRYDFDPGRAVALSLLQVALTAAILLAATRLGGDPAGGFGLGGRARRYDRPSRIRAGLDRVVLVIGVAFVLSPFLAVLISGLSADLLRLVSEAAVRGAAVTSLVVAFSAAILGLLLSTAILLAIEALRPRVRGRRPDGADMPRLAGGAMETAASLVLVVPPIVVGAGWFLALRRFTDVFATGPYVVVATNAAMAVPFIVRIVGPALREASERSGRLADSLGLSGLSRVRLVDWPAIRAPLGLAFAFALAISLGDLGAIALFGSQDFVTLPYLLLQRMGSYRTSDAAGLALILGFLCLALMTLAESGLSRDRRPA